MFQILFLIGLILIALTHEEKAKLKHVTGNRREWYRNVYLNSFHWYKRRKRALRKAGYCCSSCGSYGKLQVHHLTYANLGHEKDEDLKVLCRSCHQQIHTRGKKQAHNN